MSKGINLYEILKEQKPKTPKTWSELCEEAQVQQYEVLTDVIFDDDDKMIDKTSAVGENIKLAKSALALLKIHQLIEVGYGGNVTDEEWRNKDIKKWYFTPNTQYSPDEGNNMWEIVYSQHYSYKRVFAFHTNKQAEEFLSYPENVQLLKDYFMI